LLSGTGQSEAATMLLALARFGGQPAVVVGQQRVVGGLVGPAARLLQRRGMALAAGLRLPLVLVIDTAGPALSAEAEEGGLAGEIAQCL
ncbi:acetyl-CoA carboxyl transferase, partial [Mycobacterium sp. ITM-2017-0098]